jgi:hypothetical protein
MWPSFHSKAWDWKQSEFAQKPKATLFGSGTGRSAEEATIPELLSRAEALAIHRPIAVRSAQCAQVDESVASLRPRQVHQKCHRGE